MILLVGFPWSPGEALLLAKPALDGPTRRCHHDQGGFAAAGERSDDSQVFAAARFVLQRHEALGVNRVGAREIFASELIVIIRNRNGRKVPVPVGGQTSDAMEQPGALLGGDNTASHGNLPAAGKITQPAKPDVLLVLLRRQHAD